jgi:3'-phosphoadenosine 5'-phosphosulfate sulfotransferase (PAPS reductase)/FAD synthetase
LYRFLDDLATHFDIPITSDSDGRTPMEVFLDEGILGNNRVPICSRILKAERLQRYVQDGDTILFGIGRDEAHRALRIIKVYDEVASRRNIKIKIEFPLISSMATKHDISNWLASVGIAEPIAYSLGFAHNNCLGMGGCVRQGKGGWLHLLKTRPEKYAQMENAEQAFRDEVGKDVHILPDMTLKALRETAEMQPDLFSYRYEETPTECIGICSTTN